MWYFRVFWDLDLGIIIFRYIIRIFLRVLDCVSDNNNIINSGNVVSEIKVCVCVKFVWRVKEIMFWEWEEGEKR